MAKDLLDLHGYRTDEVEQAVDSFLMSISSTNLKKARIMTGKGKGAVKKVVTAYLKKAGYPFKPERLQNGKTNEGVLVVFLD